MFWFLIMFTRINHLIRKYLNIKFGLIGALFMGSIVFLINSNHSWIQAGFAGLKQAAYTFLFGGIIIRMLEILLVKIDNKFLSIPLSVIIVSAITIILVYIVHSLKGTPEPVLSTLPTVIMAPPGFLVLSIRFKRAH